MKSRLQVFEFPCAILLAGALMVVGITGCDRNPSPDEEVQEAAESVETPEPAEEVILPEPAEPMAEFDLSDEEREELRLQVLDRRDDDTIVLWGKNDTELAYTLGLEEMSGITSLTLRSGAVGPDVAAAIATSEHLSELTELVFLSAAFEESGISALVQSENLENLRIFRLEDASMSVSELEVLRYAPWLENLEELSLRKNDQLGDQGARLLAETQSLSNLRSLNLSTTSIGPDGIAALSNSAHLSNLQNLQLSGNPIGDGGATSLANSQNWSGLRQLDLRNTSIQDKGAQALAQTDSLLALERLVIDDNPLSHEGIAALDASPAVGEVVRMNGIRNKLNADNLESFFRRANEEGLREPDLSSLLTDNESDPGLPTPDPDPTLSCPNDLDFRAVMKVGGVPVVVERLPHVGHEVDENLHTLAVPTDEEAERLGIETDTEMVWVFSEEDGSACPMKPTKTVWLPDRNYPKDIREVTILEGDCSLDEGARTGFNHTFEYFLAARNPTMPAQCRLEEYETLSGEGGPEERAALRTALDAGDPIICDNDVEGCEVYSHYSRVEISDDHAVVVADEIEVHPWPDDDEWNCGSNIQRTWSSGILLEKDDTYHKLASSNWPTVFALVDPRNDPSMLVLTDDEARFEVWSLDDDGLPHERAEFAWFSANEDDIGGEPSFGRLLDLYCQP